MRLLAAVLVALYATGLWWSAGAGGSSTLNPGGWGGYSIWLSWTLLGIATVWTFLAERTVRPALIALGIFGAVSVVLGATLVW